VIRGGGHEVNNAKNNVTMAMMVSLLISETP